MQRVEGVVQHYAWGDPVFIPNLLGMEPDGRPWAELWLGTHPNGASTLDDGTPLSDATGPLPYLLKVLACSEPLSLQVHPNAAQAADGHARGLLADDQPKPELLCALTPFQAFCGLRPAAQTLTLLDEIGADELARVVAADGPGAALRALYRSRVSAEHVVDACQASQRPEAEWVRRLAMLHANDPSVAATILLNLVVLEPGEAIRLDAGNLHAYLHGAGIELMAASDNVVRGGLTAKPVDVDHLLEIVDPTPLDTPTLTPSLRYELPGAEVELRRLQPGEMHTARGHELTVDLEGNTWYCAPGDDLVVDVDTYVVSQRRTP